MAKVATKRKAEAQLTAGQSRNKKPRAAQKQAPATNAKDEDEDELSQIHGSESSGLFVQQSPPKKQVQHARVPNTTNAKEKSVKEVIAVTTTGKVRRESEGKKKKGGRAAKVFDEEEDFGKTESQQFLEMVRYGSKKKKETKKANEYLENFKKLIKKEQGGLETLLEEKAAESSKQEDTFIQAFEKAYTSAMGILALPQNKDSKENDAIKTSKPLNKENRLKIQSDKVLKSALDMIGSYERCEELLKTLGKNITFGEKWKGEVEKAKRILEGGKLVGEKRVASVMTDIGDAGDTGDTGMDELIGSEKKDVDTLYHRDVPKGSWAEAAKKQEKMVKKMTRLLPVVD